MIELTLNQSQDTGKLCVHVVDSDGNPIDLSLYANVTFLLKRHLDDDDASAILTASVIGSNLTVLDPSDDGVCEVTVPKSVMTSLRVLAPYFWRVSLISGTDEQSTPVTGILMVNP